MRLSFFLAGGLALGLAAAHPATAAVDQWSQIGPFGGPVTAVAVHPLNADLAYATTINNGLFKSTDGGVTWTPSNQGLATRAHYALALDPADPRRLYVGVAGTAGTGLERSTDGGATWKTILSQFVAQVVVAPSRPQTLYEADGFDQIRRSDDGGDTWRVIPGPVATLNPPFLAVDRRSPDTLYAGVPGFGDPSPTPHGLFRTTDAGATWTRLATGLPDTGPSHFSFELAQAPDRPETLYAAVASIPVPPTLSHPSAVARSTDGGATWALADGPGGLPLLALPGGRVVTDRAVSTDYGATWTPSTPPTARVVALAASPLKPERVLLGSAYHGTFRSLDGGLSYSSSSQGMTATQVTALAAAADSTLYAGTAGSGLFTGHAATLEWERLTPPDDSPDDDYLAIKTLAVHPRRPRLLYVAVPAPFREEIERTDNGGASWTALHRPGSGRNVGDLELDPSAPDTLYASSVVDQPATDCRSFKSLDRGTTFRCLPLGLTHDFAVDPIDPRNVYALYSHVVKSTDRGATWTAVGYNRGLPQILTSTRLVHAPGASGFLYLGTADGQVFRSTDGARTWKRATGNLPANGQFLNLAVDPRNPNVVYAAIPRFGVYRSKNGGGRWQLLNRGLSGDLLTGSFGPLPPLAIDPHDPDTVYVGTNSRGVFAITLTN
jgi:photosystem II stability/assembly factor-like uncharacterized protein